MKRPDPEHFDKVFVHRGCPMCSELVEKLAGDKELSPTRIRDMVSGLRRVAKALHRPLEDVPADPQWLQPRLANIAPAALGISPKAWTNILSDARTAMAHYGIVKCRRNHIDDLSPQWRHLWAIVLASDNSTLSKSLGRFVHFLNRQGVAPRDVCDEHALTYREALKLNEISKSPAIAYRTAVSGWNRAVRRIPEWPRTTLSRPSRRKVIKLPAETFPSSFLNDLDRLLDRLRRPDPLDPNGWRNPRRPTTINLYRCHILRFASELIQTGVPACQIESLQVLIDPAMAERGLRNMPARHNKLVAVFRRSLASYVTSAKS